MTWQPWKPESPAFAALAASRTKGLERESQLTLAQMLQSAYLQGFADCFNGSRVPPCNCTRYETCDICTGRSEPPSTSLPPGCHCQPGKCGAPVVMGRQMSCRDPAKAAANPPLQQECGSEK